MHLVLMYDLIDHAFELENSKNKNGEKVTTWSKFPAVHQSGLLHVVPNGWEGMNECAKE